ncbi:calcineurin-like phosphoesterase family protein [Rhizobium azibense]|uniref:Calcineurin-like phosphoesterase family protein n=1 Tax=Rhizobium azibense TaxID=1136135 RepID=A0A4R3QYP5_9HYPH|nr:metallophosphoesterase [Rhizobium azibense]TCU27693.1 calcineurin-like phosphoesterase family protein [Rhizobium azibense]
MPCSDTFLFRFGIIADPQYAAIAPNAAMDRYYANSLAKLVEAIEVFNAQELSFVMTLGDIIDGIWESFDDVLPVYEKLRHENLFLLGNHDFAVPAEHLAAVSTRLGLPSPYYAFSHRGWRFVVLDGNEVSTCAPPADHPYRQMAAERLAALTARGAVNAHPWNASLSDEQFAWLAAQLDAAEAVRERVIVMNHYPVYPPNEHDMWDRERIIDLLCGHDNAVAYFCGHNHAGNYGKTGGCHFVNFKGMVETETENAFAIVEVCEGRLEIRGFGREESLSLAL